MQDDIPLPRDKAARTTGSRQKLSALALPLPQGEIRFTAGR